MKAFHGTTRENANRLLNGDAKDGATWDCSDDEYLYLWCPVALEGEYGDDSPEYAIRMSFESAQITAATSDKPQTELVVLEFDIPESEIQDDDSCENMELARRCDLATYSDVHRATYTCTHNSRLDALVISGLLQNDHFPAYKLDDSLIEAAEILKEVWVESLHEFDYEKEI